MRLSFVIPSFNSVTWLPHAVQSAMDQKYDDLEIIIVNDGSTDHTAQYLDWLSKQKDTRITILTLPKNEGRSTARNLGNDAATGEMIMVLDADDIATPNRAMFTAKKRKDTGADFIYGSSTIINCVGNILSTREYPDGVIRAKPFDLKNALDTMFNHIVHSSCAYTKELSKKFPYQSGDVSALGIDDWLMQIQCALSGVKMEYIVPTICGYRILDSQITKTRDEKKVVETKKRLMEALNATILA